MSAAFEQLEIQCREARAAYEAHLKSHPINGTVNSWVEWATKSEKLRQQEFDAEMRLMMVHFRGVAVK